MSYCVPRSVAEAFYAAYAARDAVKVAEFLDDNVEWTIIGPVDLLPFCGPRYGKAAVVEVIARQVPSVFRIFSFAPDAMLVDGDRVATLWRLAARRNGNERVISYRLAHFMRFRDDKVVENLSLIDSFDAVQQVLGHPLAEHDGAEAGQDHLLVV